MANLDAAKGFRAIRNPNGDAPKLEPYTIAASTTIYEGTPVALNASGLLIAYTGTATGEQNCVGVAAHYRTSADTSSTVRVYDDPDQVFEIQSDDNSLTTDGDLRGVNFAATGITAGNATLLQSTAELNGNTGTSINTSNTIRPFMGIRYSTASNNDNSSTFNVVVVKINARNHKYVAGGGAI